MAFGEDGNPQGPIFFLSYAWARRPTRSQASPHDVNRFVVRWHLALGIVDAYHAYHVEPKIPTDPGNCASPSGVTTDEFDV